MMFVFLLGEMLSAETDHVTDLRDGELDVGHDLAVGEPEDQVAAHGQLIIASAVERERVTVRVELVAVDLNDDLALGPEEIDEVMALSNRVSTQALKRNRPESSSSSSSQLASRCSPGL